MVRQLFNSLMYFAEPIGMIWGLLWVLLVALLLKRRWRSGIFVACIIFLMSLLGSTGFPGWLLGTLEKPYVRPSLDDIPACDAVVVLGGGVQPSRYDAFGLDMTADADRIIMAMELMRQGKGQALVLGGSWCEVPGGKRVEADLARDWLTTWKFTDAPIESLGPCENTHDEAEKVARMFKQNQWRKVILVSSAYHLRRAEACFRTAGVPVICVPCDFKTRISLEGPPGYTLVPRYNGFIKATLFIRETVGWWIYRWRGWIDPAIASRVLTPED